MTNKPPKYWTAGGIMQQQMAEAIVSANSNRKNGERPISMGSNSNWSSGAAPGPRPVDSLAAAMISMSARSRSKEAEGDDCDCNGKYDRGCCISGCFLGRGDARGEYYSGALCYFISCSVNVMPCQLLRYAMSTGALCLGICNVYLFSWVG